MDIKFSLQIGIDYVRMVIMGLIPQEMSVSVENMQLGYIRPYHREIARRLVLGQRQCDIAQNLGMSQSRLSIICNSPLFKIELQKLEAARDMGVSDVTRTLQEISPIALEVIERTMLTSNSDGLKLKAAESILDRAGYGAINKAVVNVKKTIAYENMTPNELKELVMQRLARVNDESKEQKEMEEKASTIEISYDKVSNDRSDSEQASDFYAKFI